MDVQFDPAFVGLMVSGFMAYLGLVVKLVLLFAGGYILGSVISAALKKVLMIPEMVNSLVEYGAMTSKLWGSITNFMSQYIKWFITVLVVAASGVEIIVSIVMFMANFFWFLILTIVGLIVGGIFFRIIKEALVHLGIEEQIHKHRVEDAFGGLTLSGIIAGIVKWYIVLLFMAEGTLKLTLPILTNFIYGIVEYIPKAISGILILLISLLLARFAAERIRMRDINFAEILALGVESVVVFFGIVLALPILVTGVDVSILTDSFKLVIVGISVGLAIALGLGLKDAISDLSTRYEKNL